MKNLLLALVLIIANAGSVAADGSAAEQQAAEAAKAPGLTVVHLWAPWCGNCQAEIKSGGWTKMVTANPDVNFVFVSIWNGGEDGRAMLAKHDITDHPNVMVLADPGPRSGAQKLNRFLDLPVSWIPTTWVFKGGDMRYALNYGEVRFPILQQMLDDAKAEW
jgi:thiol-disulfide isomerase/thioredoxin